jgi:putative zinc finger/helix-turn-helix YgiT family protein
VEISGSSVEGVRGDHLSNRELDGGRDRLARQVNTRKSIMGSKKKREPRVGKCLDCGGMLETERRSYRYRFEGGLSVTLENATILRCVTCAGESVAIHAPARLHRAVAAAVVKKPSRLASSEVAFLRHHLDMTGEEMAQHLGVTKTSVSRWETGREPIGQVPDRLLRTLVLLRDWEVRPDLGLFARLGTVAKPSRIKVRLQGERWNAAA